MIPLGQSKSPGGLLWGGLLTPRFCRASPGALLTGQDVIPRRGLLRSMVRVLSLETALGVEGSGHVTALGKNRNGPGGFPQGPFKEGGTQQLRPGPVTRPSDPKDPPQPRGECFPRAPC